MNNLLPNIPVKLERMIGATEPPDLRTFAQFVIFAETEKPSWEDRRQSPLPDRLRAAVVVRDGGRCRRCRSAVDLATDHIVPVSKGQDRRIEPSDPVPPLQPAQVEEARYQTFS